MPSLEANTFSRYMGKGGARVTLQKYILLLSILQSKPAHSLVICNQATGFSSTSHHQAMKENWKFSVFCHSLMMALSAEISSLITYYE
jgi:hypothetical protein